MNALLATEPAPDWQPLRPFGAAAAAETAVAASVDRSGSAEGPAIALLGSLQRQGEDLLLRFRLQGDLEALILPAPLARPQRRDGLWQHTCFEAFWGRPGEAAYWELNASPSGDWNLYRFDHYRQGLRPEPLSAPLRPLWTQAPASADQPARLTLELRCPAPPATAAAGLEASLTAVVEHRQAGLSYWALHHPGAEPDFHDRQGFQLRL